MTKLIDIIVEAEKKKVAVGHFNISEIAALRAMVHAAKVLKVPVIVGVSEGEREFIGTNQAAALIKSLRDEYNYQIFLNADHTYSLEGIKQAVQAGFDAVMFDGSKLTLEENIKKTKEIVEYVKNVNSEILVEAELGYIRGSSTMLGTSDVLNIDDNFGTSDVQKLIKPEDLTKPEEAARFVKETGVDLLAPAVGNIHGIITRNNADPEVDASHHYGAGLTRTNAENPKLDIERIKAIREAAGVPLVLHGGSGISDDDFISAIRAGISVIHINTEIRLAWRRGLEAALMENKEEIAPYKLLSASEKAIYEVIERRLKLFNGF